MEKHWNLFSYSLHFRGKPQPPFDLVKPALPTLAGLIYSNDEEVRYFFETWISSSCSGCVPSN